MSDQFFHIGLVVVMLAIAVNAGMALGAQMIPGMRISYGIEFLQDVTVGQLQDVNVADPGYKTIESSETRFDTIEPTLKATGLEEDLAKGVPIGQAVTDTLNTMIIIVQVLAFGWFTFFYNVGVPSYIAFLFTAPLSVVQAYTTYHLLRLALGPIGSLFARA